MSSSPLPPLTHPQKRELKEVQKKCKKLNMKKNNNNKSLVVHAGMLNCKTKKNNLMF